MKTSHSHWDNDANTENDINMESEEDLKNDDMENKDVENNADMECDVEEGIEEIYHNKTPKLKNMIISKWMFEGIDISTNLKTNKKFKDLKLNKIILDNLTKNNIKYCFTVQETVIPWLLYKNQHSRHSGLPSRDVCISVPTGSGKTLSYTIPIIQTLIGRVVPRLRALIIAPTCELVNQVYLEFNKYSEGSDLKILPVISRYDSENDAMNLVRKRKVCGEEYESKIDVLITTNSYLLSILRNVKGLSLKYLQYIVFDEVDSMLTSEDNYWFNYLQEVINGISNKDTQFRLPQRILVSATLTNSLMFSQITKLFNPQLFSCSSTGEYTNPSNLQEFFIVVDTSLKLLAICHILNQGYQNVLIFVNTRAATVKLYEFLQKSNTNLVVEGLTSEITLQRRLNILQAFANRDIDVLITTDLLAHGIDFDVECVISMDFPVDIRNYAHRVGRTARCGKNGTAIILVNKENIKVFTNKIMKYKKTELKQMTFDPNELMHKFDHIKKAMQFSTDPMRIKRMKSV